MAEPKEPVPVNDGRLWSYKGHLGGLWEMSMLYERDRAEFWREQAEYWHGVAEGKKDGPR